MKNQLTRQEKDAVLIEAGFNLIWTEGQRDGLFNAIMADAPVAERFKMSPEDVPVPYAARYAVSSFIAPMNHVERFTFRERVLQAFRKKS
jgi:hypothetical protein